MSVIEEYHLSEENFSDDLDNDFDNLSSSEDIPDSLNGSLINHNPEIRRPADATTLLDKTNNQLLTLYEENDVDAYFKEFQNMCKTIEKNINILEYLSNLRNVSKEQNHISMLLENSQPNDFVSLISILNDILSFIRIGIESLHTFIIEKYNRKFPELEALIPNLIEFANCVKILETTENFTDSNISLLLSSDAHLTKEQIMILTMTMKTGFNGSYKYDTQEKEQILEICDQTNKLNEIIDIINDYLNVNVHLIAPNLTALIGSKIASLLIAHAGGILELSEVPSCNLASIGKKKHQTHTHHTHFTGVRQEGYIYHSDLIQKQDIGTHKQMLRMVCAKVALAARVDASQMNNMNKNMERNSSLGIKWRDEIIKKIRKLHEAPIIASSKALPIPEDKPKKRRAGRRYRRYKEQYKMSHLRQLQNRIEFGKQEDTILDAFGEEVGLGMSKSSLQGITKTSKYSVISKVNNNAKLTKAMKSRIKEANEQSNEYFLMLADSSQLDSTDEQQMSDDTKSQSAKSNNWYSHHL